MLYTSDKRKENSTQEYQNRRNINKKTGKHSVITEHRINNNHEFNWDNPEILDKEKYYTITED